LALLDQSDLRATHGEIARNTGAVDAAAKDENVKGLTAQTLDVLGAGGASESGRESHSEAVLAFQYRIPS
jgi:hypothetical protein